MILFSRSIVSMHEEEKKKADQLNKGHNGIVRYVRYKGNTNHTTKTQVLNENIVWLRYVRIKCKWIQVLFAAERTKKKNIIDRTEMLSAISIKCDFCPFDVKIKSK